MGNLYSKPSEDDIIKTNGILNNILQFMIKESDLLDMYDLASEKTCQQYTILTAKSLEKYFKEIQLYPSSEDGKFYFQRLDVLAKLPGTFKKEQTKACYDLSRFYVRILHIFASVSLTILDTQFPESDQALELLQKTKRNIRTTNERTLKTAPFLSSLSQKPTYIPQPLNTNTENETQIENENEDPTNLRGGSLPPTSTRDARLYYIIRNENYEILNSYLSVSSSSHFKFDGTNIKVPIRNLFIPSTTLTDYPQPIDPIDFITVEYEGIYEKSKKPFVFIGNLKIEKTDTKYTVKLQVEKPHDKIKTQVVIFTSIGGSEPRYNRLTIPSYLQTIIDGLSGKSKLSIKNTDTRKRRTLSNIGKNETVPDYFKVVPILEGLKFKPAIKAYCVARAVQLISPTAYQHQNATEAKTYVCDSSFKLLNKSTLPSSLPAAKQSIATSYGIRSLDKLFYNKFDNTSPGISKKVQGEYGIFKQGMQALYEGKKNLGDPKIAVQNIKNLSNAELCIKDAPLVTRDPDVISGLRGKAQALMNIQNTHYEKAMNILRKLFVISDTKPILLQPAIEAGGLDAVEQVAKEARELLIEYYTDCELEYRRGVDYINEKKAAFT